ncbi:MAG: gluconate 2-dehydrogenase subunit 3 family protein [Acidobacteria bacterium]|nr:gluconate 2-dehydrogenase subunit 3 family protein [Acidobacteriota bacterium]
MISRRDLLKVAGAAAAGAATAGAERAALPAGAAPAAHPESLHEQSSPRRPLEALTADEADLLTAIVARLIPSDPSGPGAVEAGAVTYIDRSLAGPLSSSREAYRRGLAALERYATLSRGQPFRELSPTDQDSLLIDVETGGATASGAGFDGSSAAFFAMLKAHTWQGTFGDPYYGGNQGFVGWAMLGYPGVRTAVTPDDQRLGARPVPLRRSAYDTDLFNKA